MKHKILTLATVGLFAACLSSCNDDTWTPKLDKEGSLSLSSLNVDVQTDEKLISRAGESIDVSTFTVAILQGESTVSSWTYSQMPEIITLPVGEYTAQVFSHQVQKQDWDKPYFLGSKSFKIENNAITEVGTVVCSFASVKVTIKYDAQLREHMGDDCQVTVLANDGGKLVYGIDETRAGYFEVVNQSTTLVATFEGSIDGQAVRIQKTYTDVAPGTHYSITYSAKINKPDAPDANGDLAAGEIIVSTDVTDVNQGGNISVEEDVIDNPGQRPGSEDPTPENPDIPDNPDTESISFTTSPSIDLTKENSVNVDEAIVYLHSDNGFAHLNVTIGSDNDAFLGSAGELMPLSFDLATISGTDAENLASVGLPVGPYPAEQTDIEFNISDLVPLLAAFPGHHSFALTIVDPQGQQKNLTLKFYAE